MKAIKDCKWKVTIESFYDSDKDYTFVEFINEALLNYKHNDSNFSE